MGSGFKSSWAALVCRLEGVRAGLLVKFASGICVHIYMYIYIHHICIYVYIFIYMYIYIHIYTHTHIYIYTHSDIPFLLFLLYSSGCLFWRPHSPQHPKFRDDVLGLPSDCCVRPFEPKRTTWRLLRSSFWVMTCFLLGDWNIPPEEETT